MSSLDIVVFVLAFVNVVHMCTRGSSKTTTTLFRTNVFLFVFFKSASLLFLFDLLMIIKLIIN